MRAQRWTTGCLAKVGSDEEYRAILATVPRTKQPTSLAEFGYHFNAEGRLAQIATGKPFAWLGQKHYDALGDALVNDIYAMLESRFGLRRIHLPLGAKEGEPRCPIFVSPDFATADVAVVLCQGSGAVRPGMWARALCINDSLETGTVFSYLTAFRERGWGVAVLNPNENTVPADVPIPPCPSEPGVEESVEDFWLNHPDSAWKLFCQRREREEAAPIPGCETPQEHIITFWDTLVRSAKATRVPIVAHSYGGKCTTALLRARTDEVVARVPCVVLTDAINDVCERGRDRDPPPVLEFMQRRSRNWVADASPLDTQMRPPGPAGCAEVSAGHERHEWTSAACAPSAFKFMDAAIAAAPKDQQ